MVDGNAIGTSYLVVSKSPWYAGNETILTGKVRLLVPFEMSVGAHLSQRTLGQEFAIEVASVDASVPATADMAISSVSQSGTTLTVNTASAHNLRPGMRVGIHSVSDLRLNYPALVVATTPSATQFTVTSGPGGTIPSVTAGPFTNGYVYYRPALGYAQDGSSMIFENATVTNAGFYVRADAGDVMPGALVTTTQQVTIATTSSVQAINAAYTYAFQPTTEYRLRAQHDRWQWSDVAIDALVAETNRVARTQCVPNSEQLYTLRIRATNLKGLSVPVGQIVSIVKSGTTTATVTLDRDHGLTVGNLITLYTLVSDAKCFRLSRTAKNQKDFKIKALDDWRRADTYALLVSPLSQYPADKSQIYPQAFSQNVTLLSYVHLQFLIEIGITGTLEDLWKLPEYIKKNYKLEDQQRGRTYWHAVDAIVCSITGQSDDVLQEYKHQERARTREVGQEGINYWTSKIEEFNTLSREQAIKMLVKAHKIEQKIETIKKAIEKAVTEKL